MTPDVDSLQPLLDWCASVVGRCRIRDTDHRFHRRSAVYPLDSPSGPCYLKIHRERGFWEAEVHAYERWARAFGSVAPTLLAVHDGVPLALLVSQLPGQVLEKASLTPEQAAQVWRSAGRALARLHALPAGAFFGPCDRHGRSRAAPLTDAVAFMSARIEKQLIEATEAGLLSDNERAVVQKTQRLLPAFAGERPTPCHRDYNPANWLVDASGKWTGVIDFEMARWDVRVADFSRYPNWEWMTRPELVDAFFEGYGGPLNPREEAQCLVARIDYALGAIIWGTGAAYFGFVREGRDAIAHIGRLLQ